MSDTTPQRVAMVTGGAIRLGKAISLALAETGWDLVVAYHTSESAAHRLQRSVATMGRRCELVAVDLGDPDSARALAGVAREHYGRLDLLVNSAASFETGTLADLDASVWDRVMALNARGPHLLVQEVAELLRTSGGSVVNLVDLSVFQAWSDYAAHSISKASLAHLTRLQARTLAPEVRVNAIAPGAVLPPDDWESERWQALADAALLQRVGSPEDVAQAVLYLADATFVTGQILVVDGGRTLGSGGPPA